MKIKLVLIGLIAFNSISAQQMSDRAMQVHFRNVEKSREKGTIIWDMDTVYAAGVPYCIIIKKSNGTILRSDYSVMSLKGKELIYVKFASYSKPNIAASYNQNTPVNTTICYYTYYFTDTKNKAEISCVAKVYKTVVEQNLVQGDEINSAEEDKFVSINGTKFSQDESNASSQPIIIMNNQGGGNIVQRNRSTRISIINGQINQDNVIVGSMQMSQNAENGIIVKTFYIFLSDGTKVAEAKCYGLNSYNWSVVTLKDNRTNRINSSFNNDAIDVVQYLIRSYYL